MRYLFSILLFFSLPVFLIGQISKAKLLKSTDPIIGMWELIRDSADSPGPELMYEEDDCGILRFNPDSERSFGGYYIDTIAPGLRAVAEPSYFVARSDGKKIYGVCEKCIAILATGEKIE